MNKLSPAARAHNEALTAYTTNEEAISTLEAQHTELLAAEEDARAHLAGGAATPAVLDALTSSSAKADALLPAINSLKAQRAELIRAVDRATGEMWAEDVRALAPAGTWVALQAIRDELAETIREAVSESRAKADALTEQAGQLIDKARQLDKRHALPRGASYSPTSGLTFDGALFTRIFTTDLAEDVGRALDAEHAAQVRTEALARHAEAERARAATNAAVDAEHATAMMALSSALAR